MHVEGTAYYVGHGAMNYMEVWDDEELICIIIVDAGSTQDGSGRGAANTSKTEVIDKIWNLRKSSVPIIMCLTHRHEDHYSYFYDFIKIVDAKNRSRFEIYLGGRAEVGMSRNPEDILEMMLNLKGLNVTQIGNSKSTIKEQYKLWSTKNNEVVLELIYNDYLKEGKNENSKGAVYLLKNTLTRNAMLFTGDMTGLNFSLLNRDGDKVCEYLAEIIQTYQVYMTLPHHGSKKSLTDNDFMFKLGNNDVENFRKLFFEKMKAKEKLKLLLSAGIDDCHYHPQLSTITAFVESLISEQGFQSNKFEAFDEEKKLNLTIIDSQSFWATTEAKTSLDSSKPAPNNIHFTL